MREISRKKWFGQAGRDNMQEHAKGNLNDNK